MNIENNMDFESHNNRNQIWKSNPLNDNDSSSCNDQDENSLIDKKSFSIVENITYDK